MEQETRWGMWAALRTIELTSHREIPGPLVMLAVAIVGTLLVEIARRSVRAARRARLPA